MQYISIGDVNNYLGTSNEDGLIGVLIENASAIFNNLIGVDTIISADYVEYLKYPTYTDDSGLYCGQLFYLKQINPTVIAKIDNVAVTVNTDYILEGQKVFLKTALTFQTTFPYKNKVEYTAGYVETPDDVKQAIYILVGALYTSKNSQGIASFSQDLLSVNYSATGYLETLLDSKSMNVLTSIVNKYKQVSVLSTGIDNTHL